MAKILRKHHKIFAENADVQEVGQFGGANATTKVNTKDIEEIQNLEAWRTGWGDGAISGNKYPSMQERNGVDFEHSYQIGYMLQAGIFEWNEQTEYTKGSIVKALNGDDVVLYNSLVDNNTGNTVTDKDYWKELQFGGGSKMPLLSFQWADHLLDDIQWLRADTFSWQSGDVYSAVYDKLVEEYATGTEETYGDGLVFKRTSSGFKITTAEHEQKVLNRYNTDMQCWFYILDTTNKRFKLPRTKWGFKGLRNNVGDMIPQSVILPNITGNFSAKGNSTASSGCVTTVYDGEGQDYWAGVNNNPEYKVYIDASRSSSVYSGDGTNTLIDERATQMYLYFYVGEYTQSAIEQTAGLNAELFNGKQDVCTHIISTYKSGTSGYRIWSDGYCEQWGNIASVASNTYNAGVVNFIKTFKDTNYNVQMSQYDNNQTLGLEASTNATSVHYKTVSSFGIAAWSWTYGRDWIARGYLAEGEY